MLRTRVSSSVRYVKSVVTYGHSSMGSYYLAMRTIGAFYNRQTEDYRVSETVRPVATCRDSNNQFHMNAQKSRGARS